jgi:hypothetical protein
MSYLGNDRWSQSEEEEPSHSLFNTLSLLSGRARSHSRLWLHRPVAFLQLQASDQKFLDARCSAVVNRLRSDIAHSDHRVQCDGATGREK